jgi:hypothetical protein
MMPCGHQLAIASRRDFALWVKTRKTDSYNKFFNYLLGESTKSEKPMKLSVSSVARTAVFRISKTIAPFMSRVS